MQSALMRAMHAVGLKRGTGGEVNVNDRFSGLLEVFRKRLTSTSPDRTVQLWDTTTGSLQHILKGHAKWVESAAFSPNKLLSGQHHALTIARYCSGTWVELPPQQVDVWPKSISVGFRPTMTRISCGRRISKRVTLSILNG